MRITLISNSCTLIELGGKRILTDPWMTEPIYWGRLFHRFGVGLAIEELGPLDMGGAPFRAGARVHYLRKR